MSSDAEREAKAAEIRRLCAEAPPPLSGVRYVPFVRVVRGVCVEVRVHSTIDTPRQGGEGGVSAPSA